MSWTLGWKELRTGKDLLVSWVQWSGMLIMNISAPLWRLGTLKRGMFTVLKLELRAVPWRPFFLSQKVAVQHTMMGIYVSRVAIWLDTSSRGFRSKGLQEQLWGRSLTDQSNQFCSRMESCRPPMDWGSKPEELLNPPTFTATSQKGTTDLFISSLFLVVLTSCFYLCCSESQSCSNYKVSWELKHAAYTPCTQGSHWALLIRTTCSVLLAAKQNAGDLFIDLSLDKTRLDLILL